MKKVLYFGEVTNTQFLNIFPDAHTFIFVSSKEPNIQMFEEHNFVLMNIEETQEVFKRKLFVNTRVNPHLFIFKNGYKKIKYYTPIDTVPPPELAKDISLSDTLYVKDYFPPARLFEYFKSPKTFVGSSTNKYTYNLNKESRNIIDVMINFPKLGYFNNYFVDTDDFVIQMRNFTEMITFF